MNSHIHNRTTKKTSGHAKKGMARRFQKHQFKQPQEETEILYNPKKEI